MAKVGRKASKRVSLHKQYKIAKKVKAHNKKTRKEAAIGGGKKLKKDPGIPNLWPFKEQFIQKLKEQKEKDDEEKKAAKKAKKAEKKLGLSDLAANAQGRAEEFEQKERDAPRGEDGQKLPSTMKMKDGSKKAYFREFKKIVETADVILEVLDARDPLGCRCPDIESRILAKNPTKKIILVLNKIDLIPKDNVEAWLKYLRNEYPTIAFKCSTQIQRGNLKQASGSATESTGHALESNECLGAETLLQLLKNYSRNLNLKTSVSVGIIGYPNVGKSSLINSLKRSRAVGVGSTPGFTKTMQEIHLDKHIKLLDCPGIVFGNSKNSDSDIILRNAVRVEQVPDPIEPVETIVKRANRQQLIETYRVGTFNTVQDFLMQVGLNRGRLGKGGVIDLKATARSILQDWNAGKIPFYTVPPKVKNVHLGSAIVQGWSKEFDIDAIMAQEQKDIASMKGLKGSKALPMEPGLCVMAENDLEMSDDDDEEEAEDMETGSNADEEEDEDDEDDEDSGDDMEDELPPQIEKSKKSMILNSLVPVKKPEPVNPHGKRQRVMDAEEEAANPQRNRQAKKDLKRQKKVDRKDLKKEAYDFSEYFGGDDDEDVKLSDI